MIEVRRLPGRRWRDYRSIRLEALRTTPEAFGSSYEEEVKFPEAKWRERIKTMLFAMSGGAPVGMISFATNDRMKTRHVAHVYSVYVKEGRRGKGVGGILLSAALKELRKKKIVKVQLGVNPEMKPALRLYEGAGFVVAGRARKELKVGRTFYDMLYMEKEL